MGGVQSAAELTGFDPYNVRSSGEHLYHPYFIAVSRGGKAH